MAKFPRREPDILMLVNAMIAGYTVHPTVFPSADVAGLQGRLAMYTNAKQAQMDKQAEAMIATEAKDTELEELEDLMKTQIKQSEVDVAADPEQLELIGWGKKSPAQPSDPPGQARDMAAIVQGPGTVLLDWKTPATGTGGTVRTYLIERRDQPEGGGTPGPWTQAGMALETEVHLMGQPRGIQLEYRVLGVNVGGQSVASNTAACVL